MHRSASARVSDDLKPKRAPFANYGWATRTKDLSNKPTHNALANKVNIHIHINKYVSNNRELIIIYFFS